MANITPSYNVTANLIMKVNGMDNEFFSIIDDNGIVPLHTDSVRLIFRVSTEINARYYIDLSTDD
jgi:hypothetical protein